MTSTNGPSQLPVMRKQHGSDILVEWVQQQIKNTQRRGLIKEAELQEQSREFLAAFTEALQQGTDINAPAWSAVREVLGSVSRSRARQGFTPSETAMFIFSLKLPLFSMLRRELLRASGMFDLAYDGKQCEDFDLGLRLYMRGAKAVLDPRMTVLHHHAPRGGLRIHGTRAVTRASSRARIRLEGH